MKVKYPVYIVRGRTDCLCPKCLPRLGPLPEPPTAEVVDRMLSQIKEVLDKEKEPMLRCKMRVSEVVHVKDENGATTQERVSLSAVYGKEGTANAQWSKWTPSANFTIHISNPDAIGRLSSGHEYFVDFTPATD